MTYSRGLVFFFLFWLTGSLLFIPNSGGYGLSLPQNCFSWAMMGGLTFAVSLSQIRKKQPWIITPALRWFAAGVVILALPLLYTRPEWLFNGGLYWAGAAVGLLFYLSCVQLNLSRDGVYTLIFLWLLACMVHALLILLQLTPAGNWIAWPVLNNRPYGVFQQVNLLATFLACGIGLALFLFLVPENRQNKCKGLLSAFALFIFPCVLVLIQSRIGWLSAIITVMIMLILMGSVNAKCQSVIFLLCGTAAGWWLKNYTLIGDISHSDSNGARLEMIGTAWEMLKQCPWTGWGAGGFEYTFQFFRVLQGKSTEGVGVVVHPHNEFLFWGVEGGAVALGGLLLIIIGGIKIVIPAWHRYRREHNPLPLALCIIILPVLLHAQTEYPFGLSALHFALCLLLLAQADKLSDMSARNIPVSRPAVNFVSIIIIAVSSAVILWMCSAFWLGLILTDIEHRGMQDIQPLTSVPEIVLITQHERAEFNRNMNRLMRYNQTHNPQLLAYYRVWAEKYLKTHTDENVYSSLIMILHYQGNKEDENYYLSQNEKLFPQRK
ncbi:O-antigen ligase family protein [Morganella psychrotolerans]|uniref:O-antigen ligase family protein n=1 Tax=Morganella psychrotolerans TaxID=368603 RepID=UPI0039AF3166